MKITGVGMHNINPYTRANRPAETNKIAQSFKDQLEISTAAKDMKVTSELTSARAERVQQLKADIQSGAYKVDARKIAGDMLSYYRI